jgi:hypothetical protein
MKYFSCIVACSKGGLLVDTQNDGVDDDIFRKMRESERKKGLNINQFANMQTTSHLHKFDSVLILGGVEREREITAGMTKGVWIKRK